MSTLSAVALVCSLKPSPAQSSSALLARQLLDEFEKFDVTGKSVRVADLDIRPGVTVDEGDGDQWPQVRELILDADILLLATPTWLGHPSSITQRVLERLDAELGETDDAGRPSMAGKVAVVAVVGNEDGAHKVIADVFQGLDDVGFTVPAQGATYWNGEAMHKVDYQDLPEPPEQTLAAGTTLARNAAHLAGLLRNGPYPPP
ncbi:flavodoxin family protein [Nocardia stercoris]|uniref:Flavodoxin n=1 Tax=Nocardia stercoris TaxID=2483361 RepID=A0A3M2L3E2_9NOCA|nr:NAD(P)H-dependent oxidoreductase [Nocardia stercoris]RMI30385.1 flavodoxin [Nocardia stercoris]